MTTVLVLCFVGLQAAFIWARYAVFRIDGPTPRAVRLIEVSATVCLVGGAWLTARRAHGSPLLDALALMMALHAAALFAWAVASVRPRQLSAAFSPDAPVELLQHGPYAYVRNPFYLAYMLGFALPAVASRSIWGALLAAWMAVIYWRAVRMEEAKFLAGPLADDFQRYCERTGRFLPRLRGLLPQTGARHDH